MAKNRSKKKNAKNSDAMDTSEASVSVSERPEAMDTSESGDPNRISGGGATMKAKKGRPMKRSKNVRRSKSIAKAISKTEQSMEKVLKNDSKKSRTQSAKLLYE